VMPAILYFASYVVYFVRGRHTLSQWWALQHEMWWFNEHLHATHTYASRAWTWIFDYRPVWYYYQQPNRVHGIISMGNPFLWWASVGALVGLVVLGVVRRRRDEFVLPLIVALLYLPWLSQSRTSFMYYLTPVAPFFALAVARILGELSGWRVPRTVWAGVCFAATAAIVGAFWLPIGLGARTIFWKLPGDASPGLARFVLVIAIAAVAGGFVALLFWRGARRWWPYLAWVYTGAVAGICIAYLPILIDLSITVSHFYHLMWFRSWI
jgi:dolichyl-phosphate-mannose--protein O-mannosyl transferase